MSKFAIVIIILLLVLFFMQLDAIISYIRSKRKK